MVSQTAEFYLFRGICRLKKDLIKRGTIPANLDRRETVCVEACRIHRANRGNATNMPSRNLESTLLYFLYDT